MTFHYNSPRRRCQDLDRVGRDEGRCSRSYNAQGSLWSGQSEGTVLGSWRSLARPTGSSLLSFHVTGLKNKKKSDLG